MKDFKQLIVWQKGFQLFIEVHKLCKKLPVEEKYELGSQIRRAAFSIPANIAEGGAKATNAHKTALLAITQLYPAYKNESDILIDICIEGQKMLISLINKLA